tara:strand:+ start:523 stop:1512 length:990 start_codon:yes stop_codon:yes gene_type:complete
MGQILILDQQGFKPLPPMECLNGLFTKDQFSYVSEVTVARHLLSMGAIDIIVSNAPDYELFKNIRQHHQNTAIILITEQPMKSYSEALKGEEEFLVDHVISLRSQGFWSIQDLRVTINKLLHPEDIFGIEKYLLPGTLIQRTKVTGSKDRETLNSQVMEYATTCRLGQHLAKMAFGITEELLMNTIHDAPLAAGLLHYSTLPRTAPIELKPEEYGELTYGCDGRVLAIASSDPFGALKKEKLFQYLKKVLRRKDSIGLIDTKKGGAGLGFFKILYSSHAIVCNVEKDNKTEIMSLIIVNEQLRDFSNMTRSIHFFGGSPKLASTAVSSQ